MFTQYIKKNLKLKEFQLHLAPGDIEFIRTADHLIGIAGHLEPSGPPGDWLVRTV
jgi:hypothetical protein